MNYITGWQIDPNGDKYRIHYSKDYSCGFNVEYKIKPPLLPDIPFKKFIVTVKGKEWHVQASTADDAAQLFWSNALPHYSKKDEVIVREDIT